MTQSPSSWQIMRRLARSAGAMERSWSVTDTETERRALFFFDATPDAIELVGGAARRLGLDPRLVDAWTEALPGCDAIGLAARDDLRSVRLYTQYWDAVVDRVRSGNADPALVYAGFKALPDASIRVDPYICLPMAPRALFMPPIREALTGLGADPEAVETAFAPLGADSCIYTRTEGQGRKSWLATVRRADLVQAQVGRMLAPLAHSVPHGAEIAQAAAHRNMVHVAGGQDGTKGRFTTLYFEAEPNDLDGFFTPR